VIWGDGSVVRDYIYVQDIARALELVAVTSGEDRVLNIGSGIGVSLRELVGIMEQVTGQQPIVEYRDPRSVDVPANVLDISLAERVLGWTPEYDLVTGLERTWEWVQQRAGDSLQGPSTPGTPDGS
jgi:UDP-glucose 4-epimerase